MTRRRVVVTGMAGISPIGNDWTSIRARLGSYRNAIVRMEEWADYDGLNTQLGAPATDFTLSDRYTRRTMRSMGRVALMATRATEVALIDAGLIDDPLLKNGCCGIAYGSSAGTPKAIGDFGKMMEERSTRGINATTYIKMMAHTAPVNIGVFFGVTGRVITTSSACTSGSQGIGYAYEAICSGRQNIMIAGGAEELCATEAAVFDTLFATSIRNDMPESTPRPFDTKRDGLVIGEGAATFILEELEHARARGATIHAEIVGFGTNSDGCHVTHPNTDTMRIAMELALQDAALSSSAIGYISAHGTGTEQGDIAESHATAQVFGNQVPISSLKSYTGHTLGACGALEAWTGIEMMREGWFAPTINLTELDPRCADLDYITNEGRAIQCDYFMSNNFAFGGINTSLIFKRFG
ncbi:beta-ketoacyl-ACP synthase [Glaciimonas sp. CA11.2]|uniref:beta-ketoacyl-ACP synthase n=1 Tax=unclassified Glaciimonas TaxID=2644401 RepID=UPI002AB39260|nr:MULTISPECIES: beta-ketoacyl-ACP synthase [unclassified Glaciimonas]MDY7547640.1 beta-ketoacyl-ACP synthase [Glaciimonas sp. CA11.2]MEB0013040.1 beta-ketoacyl-ACP synthase [Glaciimonas sp. Cout2]MEB0083607.1 beta-ketoacyl-ACP synthase [Glaciimonas sp. Gout2]MEB0161554.1 beta-ketoacyl-ACP synthase [Glaciimonas sp. CA11.2]